jgi:hypothetical protein
MLDLGVRVNNRFPCGMLYGDESSLPSSDIAAKRLSRVKSL